MRRRDFVIGSLGATLAAGCVSPGEERWSGLQGRMEGELLREGAAAFDNARKLYQTRFDHIRPQAVARCRTAQDVRACVDFARRGGIPLHVRSGGHHYAGWSTGPGLQVDVGPMNQVRLEASTNIATIGAGAQLIDIYDRLAAEGRALPGGSCPTVGIAGLVLGGGISMLGRAYGMTCDNLLSAEIVTASGEIIVCDAERHPDLFWACRGGGGGNFGIATAFRFRTHPLKRITTMRLDWEWSAAAGVMRSWQAWAPKAPDALWANCRFGGNANGNQVSVTIVFLGSEAELEPLLPGLIMPIGTQPKRTVENQDGLHAMLALAGCQKVTVPECHLSLSSAQGTLGRGTYRAKSQFFDRPLSDDGIAVILRHIARAGAVPGISGSILLDAFGGAVARVSPADTAFVHRNALFSCQYLAGWRADTDGEAQAAAWMRDFHGEMQPHASGGAFINYADPELEGWQRAYYGSNYDRLMRVKAAYDPDGLFRMPQGIPVG